MTTTNHKSLTNRRIFSGIITCVALALAYAAIPGLNQKIIVVSGSELAEPLQQLETQFEQKYPNINLELKFQGSQDIVNNYIDQKKVFVQYGFRPTHGNIDLLSVANSPWNQNIPGAEVNPQISTLPAPQPSVLGEIKRLWQRVQ